MIPNQDNKLSSDSIVVKHMQGKHDQSEHGKGGAGSAGSRSNEYQKPAYDAGSKRLNDAVSQSKEKIKELKNNLKITESDLERYTSVADAATQSMNNPKFSKLPSAKQSEFRRVQNYMTNAMEVAQRRITQINYDLEWEESNLKDAEIALADFESQWED